MNQAQHQTLTDDTMTNPGPGQTGQNVADELHMAQTPMDPNDDDDAEVDPDSDTDPSDVDSDTPQDDNPRVKTPPQFAAEDEDNGNA
jgi:hypothetical protein